MPRPPNHLERDSTRRTIPLDTSRWGLVIITAHDGRLLVLPTGGPLSVDFATEINNVLGANPDLQPRLAQIVAALPAGMLVVCGDMAFEDASSRTADLGREFDRLVTGDPIRVIQSPATKIVTFATVLWHPDRMPVKPGAKGREASSQKIQESPDTAMEELVAATCPEITDRQIKRAEQIIKLAQKHPPADKEAFVRRVNRFLDAANARIQLENGVLVRLYVAPGKTGQGFIQFRVPRKQDAPRGFKDCPIQIVRVPVTYVGQGA